MRIVVYLTHALDMWNFSAVQADRLARRLPGVRVKRTTSEAEWLAELPEADAVMVWRFRQEWFALAPRLRVLSTPAAGRDYFAVSPPPEAEMWYGAFHGVLMAETAVGMILACARGLLPATGKDGSWEDARRRIGGAMYRLRGAKVVVAGFGSIGKEVGRLASALGARVVGVNRRNLERPAWMTPEDRVVPVSALDGELTDADHVVSVLPRAADTDGFFDARRLSCLPARAYFHNIGRGNAVDERALADACRAGRLAGACLDVTAVEPTPAETPVAGVDNIWIQPHTSACAPDYLDMYVDEFAGRWDARFGDSGA